MIKGTWEVCLWKSGVLKYFLAVVREESISAAAEYLHITQPTLSRQMKELERRTGRPAAEPR